MALKDTLQRWLGVEQKYNRGTAVFISGEGIQASTDGDLEKIARQGYKKNPFVKAGVQLIANTVSTLPLILVKEKTDTNDWERIYKHPLLDLLQNPNPIMGRTGFFQHLASDLVQFGHTYIHHTAADRGENRGVPRYLYPLMAKDVTVIQGTRFRPIQRFEYQEISKVEYKPYEIIYIRRYSPTNYWYGDSDVYAAANVIDLNNAQIEWNKNLLKNRGVPPYYLVTDGFMTKEQAGELAKEADKHINGSMNAGRPFVMGGGVKIEPLGLKAGDLDWLKGMQETGRQILMSMGVRPELVLMAENVNAGNLKSAERSFILQTALPLAQLIIDAFNNDLVPLFRDSGGMKLIIDKDQVLALGEDLELTHKRARADYLSGMISRNESRDELDYEPLPADRIVEPVNVGAVGSDVDDTSRQNRPESDTEKLPNQND